eukprot:TRINITY_DN32383_c0_g1_i1.p1 TRINITY_DN32383_c0_g1~~TRINITY_DN32383_c0_g1_i1.p1  ORF type:complete len:440 (+),score=89.85 TRINITY_DN32383_c0_g1_i1:36-1322(+)
MGLRLGRHAHETALQGEVEQIPSSSFSTLPEIQTSLTEAEGSDENCDSPRQHSQRLTRLETASSMAQAISGPRVVQLFVLVHGICGSADDWSEWMEQIQLRQPPDWIVLASSRITSSCGFVGEPLEKLASLLSEEVEEFLQEVLSGKSSNDSVPIPQKANIHFIGHSLGGLIIRAAMQEITKAVERCGDGKVVMGHLVTLDTPHLGVRHGSAATAWKSLCRFCSLHRQVNLMDGRLGQSGETELSFLEKLADPQHGYLKELCKFKHLTAVSATHWDTIVPFCSAVIAPSNPFDCPGVAEASFFRVDASLGFAPMGMSSLQRASAGGPKMEEWQADIEKFEASKNSAETGEVCWHHPNDGLSKFPVSMLQGLASVPWRRVAFTTHRPLGAQVHTFALAKQQPSRRVKRWAIEFIGMLLDMLEQEDCALS